MFAIFKLESSSHIHIVTTNETVAHGIRQELINDQQARTKIWFVKSPSLESLKAIVAAIEEAGIPTGTWRMLKDTRTDDWSVSVK